MTVTFGFTRSDNAWEHLSDLLSQMRPELSKLGEIKNDPRRFFLLDYGVRNVVGKEHHVTHGCWRTNNGLTRSTYFWSKYQMVVATNDQGDLWFHLSYQGVKTRIFDGIQF